MKKKDEESNIQLNLSMDVGATEGKNGQLAQEDMEITKSRGRNMLDKETNDSTISGIANYRVMGNNQ